MRTSHRHDGARGLRFWCLRLGQQQPPQNILDPLRSIGTSNFLSVPSSPHSAVSSSIPSPTSILPWRPTSTCHWSGAEIFTLMTSLAAACRPILGILKSRFSRAQDRQGVFRDLNAAKQPSRRYSEYRATAKVGLTCLPPMVYPQGALQRTWYSHLNISSIPSARLNFVRPNVEIDPPRHARSNVPAT